MIKILNIIQIGKYKVYPICVHVFAICISEACVLKQFFTDNSLEKESSIAYCFQSHLLKIIY